MITVKWVSSVNEIPDDLWQKSFPPDLEGRWWYSVLERSELEDQFEFFYGLLLDDDKSIGIVPAFVNDVPIELVAPDAIVAALRTISKLIPAVGYQRTLFIGSPCADEGTIGLIPQITLAQVVKPIHKAALQYAEKLKAPMIVWKDFPALTESALDILCKDSPVFKMVSYPGTVIHFRDSDTAIVKEHSRKTIKETGSEMGEESGITRSMHNSQVLVKEKNKANKFETGMQPYLKGLKSSRRHNLLKKLKRSKEKFSFDVSVIQKPDQQTLDEIFALFWQTYEHGKTKFERLNIEFFNLIAEQEESWFVLLRQPNDGKISAFMLCFLLENKVINKFIGLDYQIARESSLYFRLWEAAVEWTVSCGVKTLQSGQTGYRFKIDTGNELEPLFNYCQNRNPLINTIYAQVARTISWSSLDEDLATYLKAHTEIQ